MIKASKLISVAQSQGNITSIQKELSVMKQEGQTIGKNFEIQKVNAEIKRKQC